MKKNWNEIKKFIEGEKIDVWKLVVAEEVRLYMKGRNIDPDAYAQICEDVYHEVMSYDEDNIVYIVEEVALNYLK